MTLLGNAPRAKLGLTPGSSYSAPEIASHFKSQRMSHKPLLQKGISVTCFASTEENDEAQEVHYMFIPQIMEPRTPLLNFRSICGKIARLEYCRIAKEQKDFFVGEILNQDERSVHYHLLVMDSKAEDPKKTFLYCGQVELFREYYSKKSYTFTLQLHLADASSAREILSKRLSSSERERSLSKFPLSLNREVPFPQADVLGKVMLLAEAALDLECLGLPFEFPGDLELSPRQHAYYNNAGKYLNIFEKDSTPKEIKITAFGIFLLLNRPQNRTLLLQNILHNEKAFSVGLKEVEQLPEIIKETYPDPVSGERYSLATCRRRARTVLSWREELQSPIHIQRDSLLELKEKVGAERVSVLIKDIQFKEDTTWDVLANYRGPVRNLYYWKSLNSFNNNLIFSFNNSYKEVFTFFWVLASRDAVLINSHLAKIGVEGKEVAANLEAEDLQDPFALMRKELRVKGRHPKKPATEFAQTIDDNMAFESEVMKSALVEYYALPTGRGRVTISRKYGLEDRDFAREVKNFEKRIKKEAAQYFAQDMFDILSDERIEWKEIAGVNREPSSKQEVDAYISVARMVLTGKDFKSLKRGTKKMFGEFLEIVKESPLFNYKLLNSKEVHELALKESPAWLESKGERECWEAVITGMIGKNYIDESSARIGFMIPCKSEPFVGAKLPKKVLRWLGSLKDGDTEASILYRSRCLKLSELEETYAMSFGDKNWEKERDTILKVLERVEIGGFLA